jgi:hypothetical protein
VKGHTRNQTSCITGNKNEKNDPNDLHILICMILQTWKKIRGPKIHDDTKELKMFY